MNAESKQVTAKVIELPAPLSDAAAVLQVIDRAARDSSVDIDKMERLMQMHERIRATGAKGAYAAALAQMQPELPTIRERGAIKNKGGGVQSTYALWEDVVTVITPILSRHGFALTFRTANLDKNVTVMGVLSHRDGHSEETSLTLPIDSSDFRNLVQSIGSSVSYGKRYTAAALLNLRTGEVDDDGARGEQPRISETQVADLNALISEVGADKAKLLTYLKCESLESILAVNYDTVVRTVEAKRRQRR